MTSAQTSESLNGEGGGFDGVGAAVSGDEVFADATGAEADDLIGQGGLVGFAEDGQAGADAVGGVPHGGQAGPVVGPAVHVLLVGASEELDAAEFAFFIEFAGEQVFAAVDDGFHHHVDLAAGALGFDDRPAFVDGGAHRHGAGDVFAGLEGFDGHPGVVGDRAIDVDGVDVGVFEQVAVVGVAGLDIEAVADFVEAFLVAPADGRDVGAWVVLIDGDEFGSEAEADDGDAGWLVGGHDDAALLRKRCWRWIA